MAHLKKNVDLSNWEISFRWMRSDEHLFKIKFKDVEGSFAFKDNMFCTMH